MTDEELAEQSETGDPEQGRWSKLEQLVSVVADRVAAVEYVLICAHTDSKARKPQPPEPIRRPGARLAKPKPKLTEGSANVLFKLLNGGAA